MSSYQNGRVEEEDVGEEERWNRINEVCAEMMNELCWANNVKQMQTQVKLVPHARMGSVAEQAQQFKPTWLVLDRRLMKESKSCLKQLNCNIVVVDHAIPKILRLTNFTVTEEPSSNTTGTCPALRSDEYPSSSSMGLDSSRSMGTNMSHSSASSTDRIDVRLPTMATTQFPPSTTLPHQNPEPAGRRRQRRTPAVPRPPAPGTIKSQPLTDTSKSNNAQVIVKSPISIKDTNSSTGNKQLEKLQKDKFIMARRSVDSQSVRQISGSITHSGPMAFNGGFNHGDGSEEALSPYSSTLSHQTITMERISSVRRAMSLSIKQPPTSPPLCSVCRHNTPVFGKPPRKFSYEEIEMATMRFSSSNFLAEGGYGPVYKGVLPDGQVVAVKQHKHASAQGASEFCSEVEVLSCAQHRNLVMLVGYCMDKEWLLVYEFACNSSLDKHLYGREEKEEVMVWKHRHKVAVGAARGLRYLHEDCRVGCIVHRDFRPNNILLTHDFEPMVGDFGFARWQADGQLAEETRIIGTFGYLAPEYTQTGQITEKADVYAFGVVLMELISGVKSIDLARCTGRQYLPQWALPLLERTMLHKLIDPRLEGKYIEHEVECMMYAASLCISPNPEMRPRMSKVLRILEGEMPGDRVPPAHIQHSQTPTMSHTYMQAKDAIFSINSMQTADTPSFANTEYSHINGVRHAETCSPMINELKDVRKPPATYMHNTNDMEAESNRWNWNQNEPLMNEEYQAYLNSSLAEFFHNKGKIQQ